LEMFPIRHNTSRIVVLRLAHDRALLSLHF
jgi:hypothetical protein